MTGPLTELGLSALVAPLCTAEFMDTYWERQPLHQRGSHPGRFDHLVSVDDVEGLATIALSLPDASSAVLAARCNNNEADYWDIPSGAAPNVAVHALLHAFDAGYSVVVNSIDRFWTPLAELCRRMESVLQQPVGANLYHSPAAAQGFPAHFDKHDVIILQVSGQKSWEIHPADPSSLVGDADAWAVPSPLGDPHSRASLSRGDMLYLPRGWAHRVESQDEPSLHITLGIRSLRWGDLVLRAAQQAVNADTSLHRAIPLPRDIPREAPNAEVRSLLENLAVPADCDPYQSLMTEVLQTRPPSLTGQTRSMAAASTMLTSGARLHRRPGLRPLVTSQDETVTIRFAGNGVTAPNRFGPALELVAASEMVTVAELTAAAGEDATDLAHTLVANGLLTVDLDRSPN